MSENAGQEWAKIIKNGSTTAGVDTVIAAVNEATLVRKSNQADVMVACAQIMGQVVALSGPDIAAEIRQGIMAMIDGYALQVATLK